MRKLTIACLFLIGLGFSVASCGESKKENSGDAEKMEIHDETKVNSEADSHDHSDHMATAVYQCPMKCEGEKTYSEQGTCPECKMKLAEVKSAEE